MKYRLLKEAALRELMNEDKILKEWSSDVEMPDLHAEYDEYNARRSKIPADTDEAEKDPFFNWAPPGIKARNIDNVYATGKQQKQFYALVQNANAKFDEIKQKFRSAYKKAISIVFNDEKFKRSWSSWYDLYMDLFEEMRDDMMKLYLHKGDLIDKYEDEFDICQWVAHAYVDYREGDEYAFDRYWKEFSSRIDKARDRYLRTSRNKLRKSFGWPQIDD